MGYAIGGPDDHGRFFGYGVPATCDYPSCGAAIDRGLGHACGDGALGDDNCGLYFCGRHLLYVEHRDSAVCRRCADGEPPFDPTPDTDEWVEHLLTDPSWGKWRDENPLRVAALRQTRSHHA